VSLKIACFLAWWLAVSASMAAGAAGRVRLELVGGGPAAALAFQEWNRALSKAGIQDVRLRSGDGSEKPAIDVQGTASQPLYLVTGIVNDRDELVLPGVRFRRSEAGRLKQWLDDLAANGPVERREPRGAFGLTASQFVEVHNDLAKPVGFATQGVGRGEAVVRIARGLKRPLQQLDAATMRQLDEDKIAEDLAGLSSGTALACILRPAGYCLVPRTAAAGVEYTVLPAQAKMEIWPIGWEPKKNTGTVLPALLEFLNVNVQNVSATDAMDAIAKRLKVRLLIDHNALARHGLEPEKKMVSLPQGRTTYAQALGRILFQAGLKYELRVDEADTPLLWITSLKPL
jgi:hypothetical protein